MYIYKNYGFKDIKTIWIVEMSMQFKHAMEFSFD